MDRYCLHLQSQCHGKLADDLGVFPSHDFSFILLELGVQLNLHRCPISKISDEEECVPFAPVVDSSIEHSSISRTDRSNLFKNSRIGFDDDLRVDENGAVKWRPSPESSAHTHT